MRCSTIQLQLIYNTSCGQHGGGDGDNLAKTITVSFLLSWKAVFFCCVRLDGTKYGMHFEVCTIHANINSKAPKKGMLYLLSPRRSSHGPDW